MRFLTFDGRCISRCGNAYGVPFHAPDAHDSEQSHEPFHHGCGYESLLPARVNASDHAQTHGHGCVRARAYGCERHLRGYGYAHACACVRIHVHGYADVSLPWLSPFPGFIAIEVSLFEKVPPPYSFNKPM